MNPSDSISNIGTDQTARQNSISKRRKKHNITDVWYHFEKKGSKQDVVICDYCSEEVPLQKTVEPTYIGDILKNHIEMYMPKQGLLIKDSENLMLARQH